MLLGRKAKGSVAFMGGVPAVLAEFAWSWGQLVQWTNEIMADERGYVHWMRATISDHGPARNGLVSGFLGQWLCMLDTDHQFEPDLVTRLVQIADTYEIDVLSGLYQLKGVPHLPVLYQTREMHDGSLGFQPLVDWPRDVPVLEIGAAGAGCLFVRRNVFDKIAAEFKCGAFDKIGPYSEDLSFFVRCRELKIKCFAAMNVHSNHLRVTPVTLDHFDNTGLAASEPFAVEGYV